MHQHSFIIIQGMSNLILFIYFPLPREVISLLPFSAVLGNALAISLPKSNRALRVYISLLCG